LIVWAGPLEFAVAALANVCPIDLLFFGLIKLADCRFRCRRACDVPPNDPLNLIFAPCQDFRDHADRQARDVELRCRCATQVVEVQILIGNARVVLRRVER
jgi:hypothetical protein